MKVIDIVHVTGRGYVFLGEPEKAIHVGDKIRFSDHEFEVRGIERLSHCKRIGLMLAHSQTAHDIIHKGDEVKIINKED